MKKKILVLLFIISNLTIYSQNDSIKLLVNKTKSLNLDMWDLTDFAQEQLKKDKELALFFYYWIGNNIEYDYAFRSKMQSNKTEDIYEEYLEKQKEYTVYDDRKGVCAGYANLYNWFMREMEIEVQIITGHIRSEINHYVELNSDDNFRHAWNAIKLDGEWILVDTTWGTSYDPVQSEFYFDIKPELAINTHFPEDSKWQLLKTPISLEEYNKSKFVKLIWFFSGFTDIPKLKQDNDYYYFVYKTNSTNKNLTVKLQISQDNLNFKLIENTQKLDQGGITYLRFKKDSIPKKAYYIVDLYEYNYPSYENVISFKTE